MCHSNGEIKNNKMKVLKRRHEQVRGVFNKARCSTISVLNKAWVMEEMPLNRASNTKKH